MARTKQNRKGLGKDTYLILVDGETEIWYFQLMKSHELLPRIDIKPELPRRKKLKEQYEAVVSYAKDYTQVIWMLDFDALLKESREAKKGQRTKIEEFNEYKRKLSKYINVTVLVNTPCLEFWFLLHFKPSGTYYPTCEGVTKELKKISLLNDYEKTEKYYKNRSNDIYRKLKAQQCTAISNAERLGVFDIEAPETAKAEISKVFELLALLPGL